jgi:hypothetical protein
VGGKDRYFSAISLSLKDWLEINQITWLLTALVCGTVRLFLTRNLTSIQYGWCQDRPAAGIFVGNVWGFGQCLSTAMLLLVVFAAAEVYCGIQAPELHLTVANQSIETSQRIENAAKVTRNDFQARDRALTRFTISVDPSHSHGKGNGQPFHQTLPVKVQMNRTYLLNM